MQKKLVKGEERVGMMESRGGRHRQKEILKREACL